MKKIALFLICLLLAVGVAAQSHSFRDTSYVKYEQFDLVGFLSDTSYSNGIIMGPPREPTTQGYLANDDLIQYNYTGDPNGLKVVGISAVVSPDALTVDPTAPPEYLLLYDAVTDTFELKATVPWQEADTAGRPYYDWIVGVDDGKPITWTEAYHQLVPHNHIVYDMYFDEPVRVYDSFYVGGTSGLASNYLGSKYYCYNLMRYDPATGAVSTGYRPILWKIYPHDSHGGTCTPNRWYWAQTNQWLMVLPIIEVVDTEFAHAPECPRVSGLFVRGNYTDTVTVQWTADSLHTEYELSYGREGTAAADGTIVRLNNTTRWQFTDTSYSDIPMVAYVRTVCREYDTLRRSGWSSVRWRLHHSRPDDTAQHEGIAVPEEGSDLSRFVRLMPNPASGSVVVASSYGIEGVEVYDVRGERVLELSGTGRGTAADFDVSKWAKGTYVVLVRTPAGTTTKRLVVN
jgi:hypothetical protein